MNLQQAKRYKRLLDYWISKGKQGLDRQLTNIDNEIKQMEATNGLA